MNENKIRSRKWCKIRPKMLWNKAIETKYLLWILRAVSIGYDFTKFEPECCQNINRNLFVLGMPQQMSIERLQPFDGRPPSVNWDHVVHVVTMSIWGCECRWDHVVCRSLDFDRQGFRLFTRASKTIVHASKRTIFHVSEQNDRSGAHRDTSISKANVQKKELSLSIKMSKRQNTWFELELELDNKMEYQTRAPEQKCSTLCNLVARKWCWETGNQIPCNCSLP